MKAGASKPAVLTATNDRKTRFRPSQKNTFGLLPGECGTCPCATTGPGGCMRVEPGRKLPVCYVYKLISAYSGVGPALTRNTDLLAGLVTADAMTPVLVREFERFRASELKQPVPRLFYRLHWSGDVFSREYAEALVCAMRAVPDVSFWGYTRSTPFVETLLEAENLRLYVSADRDNIYVALRTYFDALRCVGGRRVALAYMASSDDFDAAYGAARRLHEVISRHADLESGDKSPEWPKTPPALVRCPVDAGIMEIEESCSKCKLCFAKNRVTNILFIEK